MLNRNWASCLAAEDANPLGAQLLFVDIGVHLNCCGVPPQVILEAIPESLTSLRWSEESRLTQPCLLARSDP